MKAVHAQFSTVGNRHNSWSYYWCLRLWILIRHTPIGTIEASTYAEKGHTQTYILKSVLFDISTYTLCAKSKEILSIVLAVHLSRRIKRIVNLLRQRKLHNIIIYLTIYDTDSFLGPNYQSRWSYFFGVYSCQ